MEYPKAQFQDHNFFFYTLEISWKQIKADFEHVKFVDVTSILFRYEPGERVATKIGNVLLQTGMYLRQNKLILNADEATYYFCQVISRTKSYI